MHERNLATLTALLEVEQWKQADVPEQVQRLADAMVASTGVHASSATGPQAPAMSVVAVASAEFSAGVAPLLRVRGRDYHVVSTGVLLIKMLGDYSGLGEAIPDVAGRVIAATVQLLRQFNVNTTRLVLNAGALKTSAALKRITAKHLAVTLQTLGAILALLPSIRGGLVMRLPAGEGALLEELSRVTADFMQHEQRLLGQFVSISKDLLCKVCGDLAGLPWADLSTPMTVPTPPMRELVKGIASLHKILASILPPDQLADVFAGVDAMVAVHIPLQYSSVIARAVDAAVASPAGSNTTELSTAVGAEAASIPVNSSASISTASRSVAAQRLAADFSVLCSSLRQLWDSAGGRGGGDEDGGSGVREPAAFVSHALDCEVEGSRAAGLSSLTSLKAWITAQFEPGSAHAAPVEVVAALPVHSTVPMVPSSESASSISGADLPVDSSATTIPISRDSDVPMHDEAQTNCQGNIAATEIPDAPVTNSLADTQPS